MTHERSGTSCHASTTPSKCRTCGPECVEARQRPDQRWVELSRVVHEIVANRDEFVEREDAG